MAGYHYNEENGSRMSRCTKRLPERKRGKSEAEQGNVRLLTNLETCESYWQYEGVDPYS